MIVVAPISSTAIAVFYFSNGNLRQSATAFSPVPYCGVSWFANGFGHGIASPLVPSTKPAQKNARSGEAGVSY